VANNPETDIAVLPIWRAQVSTIGQRGVRRPAVPTAAAAVIPKANQAASIALGVDEKHEIGRDLVEFIGDAALLRAGVRKRAIAASLGISERTVKNHISSVHDKLDVANRVGLVRMLRDHNLFAVVSPLPGEKNLALRLPREQ
jgi:hypothetical protein